MIVIVVIFGIIIIAVPVCLIVGIVEGIVQYRTVPKPPTVLTAAERYEYYKNHEWEQIEEDKLGDENRQERIAILDETIVKYNRLLDTLEEQYKNTWNEKTRSILLAKQITTMEKLNRALEKREKLD